MDDVSIPYKTYVSLLESAARLEQLERNGVDNWSYYGCMCDETGEEECIFCTEKDIEEFLGV